MWLTRSAAGQCVDQNALANTIWSGYYEIERQATGAWMYAADGAPYSTRVRATALFLLVGFSTRASPQARSRWSTR